MSADPRAVYLEPIDFGAVDAVPSTPCATCGERPALWPDADCASCQDEAIARRAISEARRIAGRPIREPLEVDEDRDAPAFEEQPIASEPAAAASAPSRSRISAAVSRIRRRHARAVDVLELFGPPARVLADRIARLSDAPPWQRVDVARPVRELAAALLATCSVIETSSDDAAAAAVDLASIVAECELIARAHGAPQSVAADRLSERLDDTLHAA